MLIACLIEWTGGPPRPLLYCIHMLHTIYKNNNDIYTDLKSKDGQKKLFRMLVRCVDESPKLYCELGPSTARIGGLSATEQKVYDYFLYLSWKKEEVPTSFVLPFLNDQCGKHVMSDTYLRSFNIFATRTNSEKMVLISPAFVSHLLWARRFQESFCNIVKFSCAQDWLVFEVAVAHAALVWQYWSSECNPFKYLIPDSLFPDGVKLDFWANEGPKVKKDGNLTECEIKTIADSKGEVEINSNLSPRKLGSFFNKLNIGAMVRLGKMSSSCDIVVKIKDREVIELQMKFRKDKLTLNDIKEEIMKSVVHKSNYKSTFVCVCTGGINFHGPENLPQTPNLDVYIPTKEEIKNFFGSAFFAALEGTKF